MRSEPQIRLRTRWRNFSFGTAFVEELGLGCVVTTEDYLAIPFTEVANDFQVIRTWGDACR